ncbi:hypothetical protein F2Q68_00014534 [Brassica cretica]|uniref:Uncharacterized protein n=1 Tax=Brassica cretica TaxID=69181 RepID=A0A8S9HQH8_BRACR|nr:hypothetical protein F2Q68_00014534 [Brassica cretica]
MVFPETSQGLSSLLLMGSLNGFQKMAPGNLEEMMGLKHEWFKGKAHTRKWSGIENPTPNMSSTHVLHSVHHQTETKKKTLSMLSRAYTVCIFLTMEKLLGRSQEPVELSACHLVVELLVQKTQVAVEKRSREEPVDLSAAVGVMRSWFKNSVLLTSKLGPCWGQKLLFRNQRLRLFLIHGILSKHSLKERLEVNERANPAQKPLAGELNRHAGQLTGRAQPSCRSARRRAKPPCGCTRPVSSATAPVSSPAS